MSRSTSKDAKASEDETDLLPSWALIDFRELEIQDRIGGGGIGVIYKGRFRDGTVAIKALFDPRINESLKKEFMDELLTMSKVKHSNIVSFIGASMTPPNLCFVMEMCQTSLFHILHHDRVRFSEFAMIQMSIDVASAMEYLHALKPAIIHRDLKSLNVLKAFDGSLKLCDFGLVKVKGSQAGTPSYMAPELFRNAPFNRSVDVFAFGVLLWEIFSQDIPWYQVPIPDVKDRVVAGDRPTIESFKVPSKIARLIERCWTQHPEDRPTFTEVVDELCAVSDATPQVKHAETIGSGDTLDFLLGGERGRK